MFSAFRRNKEAAYEESAVFCLFTGGNELDDIVLQWRTDRPLI
jgi:hypothetical protein